MLCCFLLRHIRYKQAGQFIKWSLQQGGPCLRHLSRLLYHLMVSGGRPFPVNDFSHAILDIPDMEVQDKLTEV